MDEPAYGVQYRPPAEPVGRTGGELEALNAVQVGLLIIYDMCKAVDRGMVMTDVRVLEKQGGKSGEWKAEVQPVAAIDHSYLGLLDCCERRMPNDLAKVTVA